MDEILKNLIEHESALLKYYEDMLSDDRKLSASFLNMIYILKRKEENILQKIRSISEKLAKSLNKSRSKPFRDYLGHLLIMPGYQEDMNEKHEKEISGDVYWAERSLFLFYFYLRELSDSRCLLDELVMQRHISFKLIYNFREYRYKKTGN